jgi:hypothetical protein
MIARSNLERDYETRFIRTTFREFFLVLSTFRKAYRRCELAWVNGNEAGVHFIKAGGKKRKSA